MKSYVASCQEGALRGMEHFLMVFSHVPGDKLDWTPSPSAKSALRIAAHTAVTAGNFASMIRARKLPVGEEIPIVVARTNAAEVALTSREEIVELLRKNTDKVVQALATVPPEEIEARLDSSLGWSMPMSFLMNLPEAHAMMHAGQIDYLQTCWGDLEVHF